jgi:hypothetical protein
MSAPITDAHRKLRETLEIRWMRATEWEIEQLIADSEAKACAELRVEQAEGKVAEQGLTLACLCDGILGEDATDRSDQTLLRVGCAMKQELAKERARLDAVVESCWLVHKGNENMFAVFSYECGDYITPWVATPRAAIDAAMKEDAK